jgi:serine/threonine protein phosphatase PrpC
MKPVYMHGKTDVGQVREVNEDAVRIASLPGGGSLLIVCDGLGGHGGGDVASKLAADVIAQRVFESVREDPRQVLFEALVNADQALHDAHGSGGSTVVVAWIKDDQAWVAWMGDSRLLHIRNDAIIEVTRDHTRVQDLMAGGELTEQAALSHPDRHVVTRALGAGDANPDVWEEPIQLKDGDALLLITDGVHDLVQPQEVLEWVSGVDYRDAVESLVRLANDRGGTDNITAAIAVIGTPRLGGTALAYADRQTPQPANRRLPGQDVLSPVSVVSPTKRDPTPPDGAARKEAPQVSSPASSPSSHLPLSLVVMAVVAALMLGLAGGFVARGLVQPPPTMGDLPGALP